MYWSNLFCVVGEGVGQGERGGGGAGVHPLPGRACRGHRPQGSDNQVTTTLLEFFNNLLRIGTE